MNDVVFCVRAARDCHALIYIVDTDGFIHVVHPFSPYESAWIEGGYTYRFTAAEAGLYGFDFDRGIAFIYAVGSPHPFVYADYGINIFAGRFAFRIYGDPFYACKRFYISLLPRRCNYSLIGVSYAHFYVRDWVRYPWYLCSHRGTGYRGHGHCAYCDPIYERYRYHTRDPYRILNPTVRYKGNEEASLYSTVAAVSEKSRAKILHERGITQESKKQRTLHKLLHKPAHKKSVVRSGRSAPTKNKVVPKGKSAKQQKLQTKKPAVQKQPHLDRSVKRPADAKPMVTKRPAPAKKPVTVRKPVTIKRTKIQSPKKSVVRSSKEMVKREKSRTQALKKTVRSNNGRVGHEQARAKPKASKTKEAPKKAVHNKQKRRQ
jgi:hypothetical protein